MKTSLLCIGLFFTLAFSAASDIGRQANEAYERGAFEEAERLYEQAIEQNPGDSRLHFNLGNTLAQQGKLEAAAQSYERFRTLAQSSEERALADYSLGNLKAIQQEWEGALDQYREALRQSPDDPDAMHNYEYAMRQMQQEQEQEQEQPPDDGGDSQGQDSGEAGEGQPGGEQQQQPGPPGDAAPDEDEQSATGEPQPEPGQEGSQELPGIPEGQMSPEEAEQLLNAISNREQDLLRDFLKDLSEEAPRNEKDW